MAGRSGESQPAWRFDYWDQWRGKGACSFDITGPSGEPYWFEAYDTDLSEDCQELGRFILKYARSTPEWPIFALIYDYD